MIWHLRWHCCLWSPCYSYSSAYTHPFHWCPRCFCILLRSSCTSERSWTGKAGPCSCCGRYEQMILVSRSDQKRRRRWTGWFYLWFLTFSRSVLGFSLGRQRTFVGCSWRVRTSRRCCWGWCSDLLFHSRQRRWRVLWWNCNLFLGSCTFCQPGKEHILVVFHIQKLLWCYLWRRILLDMLWFIKNVYLKSHSKLSSQNKKRQF